MLLSASLIKLDTELVAIQRPKMPLLSVLALVEMGPLAPEALLLARLANVSRKETAEGSDK